MKTASEVRNLMHERNMVLVMLAFIEDTIMDAANKGAYDMVFGFADQSHFAQNWDEIAEKLKEAGYSIVKIGAVEGGVAYCLSWAEIETVSVH